MLNRDRNLAALIAYQQAAQVLMRRANRDISELPSYLQNSHSDIELIQKCRKLALSSAEIPETPPSSLRPIFSEIFQEESSNDYAYPLKSLTAESIFPEKNRAISEEEYQALFDEFVEQAKKIPQEHQQNLDLLLDHLDTLWSQIAAFIPVSEDISLYDLTKNTAALAVALQGHIEVEAQDTKPFLLIQGDFAGIQEFIFAQGAQLNKNAANLLRGRSFYVSLLSELAALKLLQACELPCISQLMNAAGKFQIIAPNTAEVRRKVSEVQAEINAWLLENTFGEVAIALSTLAASEEDFSNQENYANLIKKSFQELEKAKLQVFDLTSSDTPVVFNPDYSKGENDYNEHLPKTSPISNDQIAIGSKLTTTSRLWIFADNAPQSIAALKLAIFGYTVAFSDEKEIFTDAIRVWDFSISTTSNDLWNGLARRNINSYIPFFSAKQDLQSEKYLEVDKDVHHDRPKSFEHLAAADRELHNGKWQGKVALGILKGDIDNLGRIFQAGLQTNNLCKTTALSRQVNIFFTVYLPYLCRSEFSDTYTVFAGGDDFFLIGPWHSIQKLAVRMRKEFSRFVANNEKISFCVGISTHKPSTPVARLAQDAEFALDRAKAYRNGEKNAVCLFNQCLSWADWDEKVQKPFEDIRRLQKQYSLSTGYIYGCLAFLDMREKERNGDVESALWRSRLAYRTTRFLTDNRIPDQSNSAYKEINSVFAAGIENNQSFRIALFNHFYLLRDR